METIDIQNRSFVVRWVKCSKGDVINYQLKPLKKSIELGIYKKHKSNVDSQPAAVHIAQDTKALLDYTNKTLQHRRYSSGFENEHNLNSSHSSLSISNIQQQSQEIPLRDRLAASGFTLVKWVGHIQGNNMMQNVLDVKDNDFYYAFILDNTSSKNVKKKVLFKAGVINDDNQSIISTRSSPILTRPSSNVRMTPTSASSHVKDTLLRVDQGRYLQGYLLKKRRKKLQGFKKRFFTLDFKYGTLSYYLNDHNQTCRGEIVISLSTVSANKKDRLIIIDSGMEVWALKATDTKNWQNWVDALQSCFESQKLLDKELERKLCEDDEKMGDKEIEKTATTQNINASLTENDTFSLSENVDIKTLIENYVPLPDKTYTTFTTNLKLIQQKLESCKNDSLSYTYTPSEKEELPLKPMVVRSSSSSSSMFTGNKVRAFEKFNSAMDSSESLISPLNKENQEISESHELYKRLSELESFVDQFVIQSELLLKDYKHITKHARETSRLSLTSGFSDNDEYFDAIDHISQGVILLEDEEADEVELTTSMSASQMAKVSADMFNQFSKVEEGEEKEQEKETEENEMEITSNGGKVAQKHIKIVNDLYPLPFSKTVKRRNDVPICKTIPPSLLSFLRKNVGKDLTSIALPVTSNEPITILQMISESFQYASLLTNVVSGPPEFPPITAVTLFAISFLSVHRDKTRALRKPFNPLLGETYELVQDELGFRLIAEKVSHKPQIFAFHAEHNDWECNYTVTPTQKFWGKSIELNNEGVFKLKLKATGELFEWEQPTTMLKNLIAGERYVEPINDFEVISSNGSKAKIDFERTGMFSGRSEAVNVSIMNKEKKEISQVVGKWSESLKDGKTKKILWKPDPLLKDSKKKYGFTQFSANLNEITDIERDMLPPTDSRLRPDVRSYENGDVTKAEALKLELEQKQRERRNKKQDAKPRYFKKDSLNNWKYIEGPNSYWEKRRRQSWEDIAPLW
ncbi:oxysterol-binding protein related protein OSH3 NDAI_0C01960 [Naumovozyma dairenensis CBS 421]|uniref:PH domain-containing protein n=1 Tax=Naumovozyma dairenensis (strain ATCC 10597 / BCRC 20456 / CBS 421 / NBRC 0211 / NRRL Y-12639) TaxID=1071378 RepID=G0W7U5_NAUDC|nr:hypothetical protein NDAI_0C01960 [Naumovozyma dairenensis CBS 421]CCD23856.1 hypothetical protein NDAI_0C01960 [Naumovozyma dairenensis CBS 421]